MYSKLREKLGPAGLIVAVVALVASLAGGAYAASNGLSGKQKKEVKAIAKQFAGKPGATGAQGPAGANGKDGSSGTAGAKGDKGDPGTPGVPGTPGTPGTNGKNVKVLNEPAGVNCADGGVSVEVEGSGVKNYVCDGSGGTSSGPQTGTFHAQAGGEESPAAISFASPLADPASIDVHVSEEAGFGTTCTGSAVAPTAPAGNLCVYITKNTSPSEAEVYALDETTLGGVSASGALIYSGLASGQEMNGSFAVTPSL